MIKQIYDIYINTDNIESIEIQAQRISGFSGDTSSFYVYDDYMVVCSMTSGKTISFPAKSNDEAENIVQELSRVEPCGRNAIDFYAATNRQIEDMFNTYLKQYPLMKVRDLYLSTVGSELCFEVDMVGKDVEIEDRFLYEFDQEDTPLSIAQHFLGEFKYAYERILEKIHSSKYF